MAGYLANSDFERLSTLAHDLKGTGESFGFSDLTRLGAAIELSAVESDPEAVGKQLTELENYLKRVRLVAKG
jgi:HPt (histidine-containing phosphotransfer) domain-containing protein